MLRIGIQLKTDEWTGAPLNLGHPTIQPSNHPTSELKLQAHQGHESHGSMRAVRLLSSAATGSLCAAFKQQLHDLVMLRIYNLRGVVVFP